MSNLSVNNKNIDTILVLDFGSQYTQLIARRVRESDVYSEILPWDINENKIIDLNPKGIILSGGPNSVTDSFTPRVPKCVFEMGVPILGICYGMQTLAEQFCIMNFPFLSSIRQFIGFEYLLPKAFYLAKSQHLLEIPFLSHPLLILGFPQLA